MDAMEFVVEKQLKSLLLDEDPTKIEFLHQKMMWNNWANGRQGMVMGAISGIDVALWDILGKVANLPVCKLLGQVSDKVQGYAAAFLIAMHLHFSIFMKITPRNAQNMFQMYHKAEFLNPWSPEAWCGWDDGP